MNGEKRSRSFLIDGMEESKKIKEEYIKRLRDDIN